MVEPHSLNFRVFTVKLLGMEDSAILWYINKQGSIDY